jgi:hypothetical protein
MVVGNGTHAATRRKPPARRVVGKYGRGFSPRLISGFNFSKVQNFGKVKFDFDCF